MKDNEENNFTITDITIPIMIYEELILIRQKYYNLIDYLFDKAKLSYSNNEKLLFDTDLELIKYFCPMRYTHKIKELQEKKEENNV